VRAALHERLADLVDRSVGFHVILEGSGFTNTAKRAVLSAMLLGKPGSKRMHVHSNHAQVVSAVSRQFHREVSRLFRELSSKGLLTGSLGDSTDVAEAPFSVGRSSAAGRNLG